MDIKNNIIHGFVIRIILTIIFIIFLQKMKNVPIINQYFYLLLFIGLLVLDCMDNFYFYKINDIFKLNEFRIKTFEHSSKKIYQVNDKIIDILTYILLFLFDIDNSLKFFILYRLIGVLLYIYFKDPRYLIIFFDFVKEYMLYVFIFKKNTNYLLISIVLKIYFEYFLYYYRK